MKYILVKEVKPDDLLLILSPPSTSSTTRSENIVSTATDEILLTLETATLSTSRSALRACYAIGERFFKSREMKLKYSLNWSRHSLVLGKWLKHVLVGKYVCEFMDLIPSMHDHLTCRHIRSFTDTFKNRLLHNSTMTFFPYRYSEHLYFSPVRTPRLNERWSNLCQLSKGKSKEKFPRNCVCVIFILDSGILFSARNLMHPNANKFDLSVLKI